MNWKAVRADGIRFAYLKATEGATFRDRSFQQDRREATAAGIPVGAYHFFTLCASAAQQADNFLRATSSAPEFQLPPALDLELAGNCHERPAGSELAPQVNSFVNMVERSLHTRVLIYEGADFASRYGSLSPASPRWVRRLIRRPPGHWCVWQASDTAHVNGIRGRVDLDIRRPCANGRRDG